ncbi:MAG: UDP-N-acetylmuramoyl-tripeptide--D-alanyl-D-alanine ligase [Elusimicrobiota bacterium]|nr:UDP-N-acetylmuramoyl-tripeptide--D-alanyl-D-alanine ligase [Elusimicrobiota bacterium]
MERLTIKEVIKAVQGELICGSERGEISGVSIDSRSIKKGEIFFALKGERFDGHDFFQEAIEKGAKAAVISKRRKISTKITIIHVAHTLTALQELAKFYRRKFRPVVVAVTGSNGKTTTKDMLQALLSSKYRVTATAGNYNNIVGLPLTLFEISPETEFLVVEMATNHAGEIRRLAEISLPQIGVITNIGATHLQFFRCISNVLSAKMELVQLLPRRGKVALNIDDAHLRGQFKKIKQKIITFGTNSQADVRADNIVVSSPGEKERLSFTVYIGKDRKKFDLYCLGRYNIYNALAAISVAREFGVSLSLMAEVLGKFKFPKLRMEKLEYGEVTIVNDAYNANPTSVKVVLREFISSFPSRRKMVVLGDMLELGRMSQKFHQEIGKIVAASPIHNLIAIGEDARFIAQAAGKWGMERENIFSFKNKKVASRKLKELLKPKDAVLIKGSRKMGLEEIIKYLS